MTNTATDLIQVAIFAGIGTGIGVPIGNMIVESAKKAISKHKEKLAVAVKEAYFETNKKIDNDFEKLK